MPDASDMRAMAVLFRPINRLFLRLEGAKHVVRVVLHNVIVYSVTFGAALRARFDVNYCHVIFSPGIFLSIAKLELHKELMSASAV
jgi:hypothetical protein